MALPQLFFGRLSVPVIAAPMFLLSGPELVIACCRAGVVDSSAADIVYTDASSGTPANFLRSSLLQAYGADWALAAAERRSGDGPKAWRDAWSAGHGVATIHDLPTVAELVARSKREQRAASALPRGAALVEQTDSTETSACT